jgi:hypothetical protein
VLRVRARPYTGHVGKYDRWEGFFRDLEGDRQEIPIEVLEALVEGELPPTAVHQKAWWSGEHYHAWWLKAGWFASLQPDSGTVIFSRTLFRRGRPATLKRPSSRSPSSSTEPPAAVAAPTERRVVLVGCVAQKQPFAAPARELYVSPLWQKRRRYAESTGMPWFVLSAEYGVLESDRVIEPYDRYMEREDRAYREQWARSAVRDVLSKCREHEVMAVEVHAGAAYLEHGLISGLRRSGIRVIWPLRGHQIGRQLGWYDRIAAGPQADTTEAGPKQPATPKELVRPSHDHAMGVAEVYRTGVLGESWSELPEAWSLPDTDPTDQRLWLTFVASVDRARDAAALWRAARDAWVADRWIFSPAAVIQRGFVELADALRFHGVSQRHMPDTAAWRSVAEALVSAQGPQPIRDAVEGRPASAEQVLGSLAATWPHGTLMFPQLSGPKIGPMWVRMLAYPGGAAIGGLEVIPVAVDTHVQRVTEMLGLVAPRDLDDSHRRRIQSVWFEAVADAGAFGAPAGIDGTAAGLDPALWALGKEGCSRCERAGGKVSVGAICDLCVLGRI